MSQTKYLSRKRPVSECKTLSQERWSQFPFEISKNEIRDDGFDDIKVDIQTKKDGFDSIKVSACLSSRKYPLLGE